MMKKHIFILTLIVLTTYSSLSAQVVFNKSMTDISPIVAGEYYDMQYLFNLKDTAYISAGLYISGETQKRSLTLVVYSLEGDVIQEKKYNLYRGKGWETSDDHAVYHQNQNKEDGLIYVTGHCQYLSNNVNEPDSFLIYFSSFDRQLNQVSSSFFLKDTVFKTTMGYRPLSDKSWLIWGYTPKDQEGNYQEWGEKTRSFLLKIDSTHHLLWSKEYYNESDSQLFGSLIECSDKGFLISESTIPDVSNPIHQSNLIKMDSLGNIEWTRNLNEVTGLNVTHSGNLYYINHHYYLLSTFQTSSQKGRQPFLLTMDSTFQKLSVHTYGDANMPVNNSPIFMSSCFDPQGRFVSTYQLTQHNFDIEYHFYYTRAYCWSLNGDSIWRRDYATRDTVPATGRDFYNRLFTIQPTADHGYIIGGSDDILTYSVPWLVKVDSLGCDGSPWLACNEASVNPEDTTSGVWFKSLQDPYRVYPNPVADILTVEINSAVPIQDIAIYDVRGQKMFVEPILQDNGSLQFKVSHFPTGVYFVKVGRKTRKFIKG